MTNVLQLQRHADDNENKYGAIVGNPPYQIEVAKETRGDQKTVMNVFHRHQKNALLLAPQTCLIYPGERWINRSGKGLREFGQELVNAPHLERVVFWPHSKDVFEDVKLGDGISVVHCKKSSHNDAAWILDYRNEDKHLFDTVLIDAPGLKPVVLDPRVQAIIAKTLGKADRRGLLRLSKRTTTQKTFAIESNFVQLNPEKVSRETPPADQLHLYCRIFTNDIAGKAGRAQWFWLKREAVRTNTQYIDKWKVIVSSMNPVGARGTGHSPLAQILKPGEIFGRSRIGLGVFDTEEEASNFFKFASTDFMRFHYACLGDSQTLLGMNAPDPGGFTSATMDFSGTVADLNERLYLSYELVDSEREFIHNWVRGLSPFHKN